ncbi:uncharacterized protein LOC133174529 [Saccostrea echinata]|uniref:uncharacterized protein LOC133174529 n=1 Tax=Saccostrea echinata TaxID=191078 RepID=UPI002A82E99A|nr:uncharacterized protein LOC133174529 [Saccostrea echinata]
MQGVTFYILFLYVVFRPFMSTEDIEVPKLLEQILTLCGTGHFCYLNKTLFPWEVKDSALYPRCPPCFCDQECFIRGDCCPDMFFSPPVPTCKNVTIVNASSNYFERKQRTSYLMIDSCPHNTEINVLKRCENVTNDVDKLKYPPVTSYHTTRTYYNRFCAICNDDFNFFTWPIDIVCDQFLDINFMSTFDEVIKNAMARKCVLQSYPPNENISYNCYKENEHYFNSCNKTGTWKHYIQIVEYGCDADYFNNDTLFKNMFCKMCNPTFTAVNTISRCNVSGMWDTFNRTANNACLYYRDNSGTLPYKNLFCYLCNRPNSSNFPFFDVSLDISTELLFRNESSVPIFYFYVDVREFSEEYFLLIKQKVFEQFGEIKMINQSRDLVLMKHNNSDLTNLVHKSYSMDFVSGTCGEYKIPTKFKFGSNCSCDASCIFLIGSKYCCQDLFLMYPTTCLKERIFSKSDPNRTINESLVTNGCYGLDHYPEFIGQRCRKPPGDVFSIQPVTDLSTGIPYLNMYCLLCSVARREKIYKPWTMKSHCFSYIEHTNFLHYSSFIKSLREADCNMTLYPPTDSRKCDKLTTYIVEKCNKTGHWPMIDLDVRWACEDLPYTQNQQWNAYNEFGGGTYKNIYCAMCNPYRGVEITIDKCPDTYNIIYNYIIGDKCDFFPKVYFYAPYKNLYCAICNTIDMSMDCGSVVGNEEGEENLVSNSIVWYPLLRSLFSVSGNYDEMDFDSLLGWMCSNDQIYDPFLGICRNITCFPGKYLIRGESCIPLFSITKNLRYNLDITFKGFSKYKISEENIQDLVTDLIPFKIKKIVKLTQNLFFNIFRIEYVQKDYGKFHGWIHSTIFINESVHRLKTERLLIQFTETNLEYICNDTFILFDFKKKYFSLAKNNNNRTELEQEKDRCSHTTYGSSWDHILRYRAVHITNVLICKQVEFKLEEYEFDSIQNVVFLKSYDISLPAANADISKNGTIRVCVDVLMSSINRGNNFRRILLILTVTFSILSCVCLLMTFLTYCFFGELRSLAGKTIMVLVFTIFTINIVSLTSYGENKNSKKCVAVGILLHYFWLSSFTSMNICCFHMYRVFHARIPLQVNNEKFLFIKYCIYIFLLPFLTVFGYLITMFSVWGNVGYGKQDCFIDGKMSLIFTFLVPVGFLCIGNVFFFSQTIRAIKLSPTVSSNKPERNDFLICVRLFPVTGVIWLLQILDGLLPQSYFTYIISVMNTSQGVFIFLGFVCNKRTILMFKKTFKEKTGITKSTDLKSACETPKMMKCESSF